jgi:hypothetical protein
MPTNLLPLPIFLHPDISKPTFGRLAGLRFLQVMLSYKQLVAHRNDQVLLNLHVFNDSLKGAIIDQVLLLIFEDSRSILGNDITRCGDHKFRGPNMGQ